VRPETEYAKSSNMHIAYQVVGEGSPVSCLCGNGRWTARKSSREDLRNPPEEAINELVESVDTHGPQLIPNRFLINEKKNVAYPDTAT
jgi:hypothetical protein